ncbi:protein kinase [Pseudomonas sp. CA3A]|uniref:non-specific serine/threonine protein kinase n=1 Tax=Pseudomonas typographi TaxID=2715964 RepID=A0ABR7Z508_9PSED|nr:protein kinase [Pseudomonas typographi]
MLCRNDRWCEVRAAPFGAPFLFSPAIPRYGLAWGELQRIAIPLLEALCHCHEQGVLHGDLKPSNIMFAEGGLRLFDFGLGRPMEGLLPGLPRLCRSRIAAWTPCYAAPEILEGAPLSATADVFGLACVLVELANGQHPFSRLGSLQAREQQLEKRLQRPTDMPRHCWHALRTALAFDEPDRRGSCAELLDAFRRPASRLWPWQKASNAFTS